MKLYPAGLSTHLANKKNWKKAYLIFGRDEAYVDQLKDKVIEKVAGPNAAQEFRLERIAATDLVSDPNTLRSLVEAQGFFGGQRMVCVHKATEQNSKAIFWALDSWKPGHAVIVITASQLRAGSTLRKKFDSAKDLVSLGVYVERLNRSDLASSLQEAGLNNLAPGVLEYLEAVVSEQEPAVVRSLIAKLALYKLNDESKLTDEDIRACAPEAGERGLNELIEAVADRNRAQVSPILRKLSRQDREPVKTCIVAKQKFRGILAVVSHKEGKEAGISGLVPPVFGSRRDRIRDQANKWSASAAAKALIELAELDRSLRRPGVKPSDAVVERTLLRITGI